MVAKFGAEELIQDLLSNSSKFYDKGRGYDLLQHYFHGFPVETLRPLLRTSDQLVRRVSIWIAAELGCAACDLVPDVIPLLHEQDRYLTFHALEVLAVCAIGKEAPSFAHVVQALEHDDVVIRQLAMRMVSNAVDSQIQGVLHSLEPSIGLDARHRRGLSAVLSAQTLDKEIISTTLRSSDALDRRYGAILARRRLRDDPGLISAAASLVDEDIRKFASETVSDNLSS